MEENNDKTELEAQIFLQTETNSRLDSLEKSVEVSLVEISSIKNVLQSIETLLEVLATKPEKEIEVPDHSLCLEKLNDSVKELIKISSEEIKVNLTIE